MHCNKQHTSCLSWWNSQSRNQHLLSLVQKMPLFLVTFFSANNSAYAEKVRMYYRSGTDGCCCICAWQTLRFYSLGGSTVLSCVKWGHAIARHVEIMTNGKSDLVSRCIFMWRTSLPNFIPIRFETMGPQAVWRGRPNKKNKYKKRSKARSVPDLKTGIREWCWFLDCVLLAVWQLNAVRGFFKDRPRTERQQCLIDVHC